MCDHVRYCISIYPFFILYSLFIYTFLHTFTYLHSYVQILLLQLLVTQSGKVGLVFITFLTRFKQNILRVISRIPQIELNFFLFTAVQGSAFGIITKS